MGAHMKSRRRRALTTHSSSCGSLGVKVPVSAELGRLSDERAEWQVVGRRDMTAGGKTVHVCVESVKQPGVTDIRTRGAHERVAVTRSRAGGAP